MIVKELIELIKDYPDNEIYVNDRGTYVDIVDADSDNISTHLTIMYDARD
jgi:hypothetical protein